MKLISPPNPADPIKLVARQKVEFSMTYPPDIIQARETGIPVQSVAAILRSFPWGLIVEPDIKSPIDLKGKTIGASSTQTGRFFLETMIKSAGLDPKKDVNIIAQGYGGVQLLESGKIQGTTGLGYGELVTVKNAGKKAGKSAPGWLDFSDYGVPPFAPKIGGSIPDYPSVLSVLRFPGRWPKLEVPREYSLDEVLLRGDHRFVYSAIADCGPHSHGEAVAGYGHEGFGGYFGLVGRHKGPATRDSGIEYRIELSAGRLHYEDDDFGGSGHLEIRVGEDVPCKEWVTYEFSLIRNPVRWRAAFTNPCNGKREWVDLYIQPKHEFLFRD